jgi:hypothetical protein
MGTGVKKHAFWNTAKERIISWGIGRILPIPVDIQRLFRVVDTTGCVCCSPKFLKGERSPVRAYFTCPGDEVPKKKVWKDTLSRTAVSYIRLSTEKFPSSLTIP